METSLVKCARGRGTRAVTLSLAVLVGVMTGELRGQQVYVVDDAPGPGVDVVGLQAAVDGAASGDVLLVRPGDHLFTVIDGKALTVVSDGGGTVDVGGLAVRNAPLAGVVLQGLQVVDAVGLRVEDCPGPVRIEGCFVSGAPATTVRRSASTALVDCVLTGFPGGEGLVVENSGSERVHVLGSSITGGLGQGSLGVTGLLMDGGDLVLISSQVEGGQGASFSGPPCSPPQGPPPPPPNNTGGTGLEILAGVVYTLDAQLVGGQGGLGIPQPGCPTPAPGPQGAHLLNTGGTFGAWSGTASTLTCDNPLREGDPASFDLQADAPGALAVLVASPAQAPVFVPTLEGSLFPDAGNLFVRVLGPLSAQGETSYAFTTPDLPAGLEGLSVHAQAAVEVAGDVSLSTPVHTLVLDAGL